MCTTAPIATPAIRRAGRARLRHGLIFLLFVGCLGVPGAQAQAPPAPPQTPAPIQEPQTATPAPQAPEQPSPAPAPQLPAPAQEPQIRTTFRVKYAIDGAAYLDGGRNSDLAPGMVLIVKRPAPATAAPAQPTVPVAPGGAAPAPAQIEVARLVVSSVAESSAVCDIQSSTDQLRAGDIAYLSQENVDALVARNVLSGTRKYPQVITFTEGDPLEEEAREAVPRPPLPEVNRARGRIGVEYGSVRTAGGASTSSLVGLVVRTDISRIGGSYWGLSGYWRGRMNLRASTGQPTLEDLLNRTYHLSLTYNSPKSHFTMGVGRLLLPYASSLDTLDGGYFGIRINKHVTTGIFAGTTPDPTSWNYNPDRRMGGTFLNLEGGSFDGFRFTSTTGVAVTSIEWVSERRFLFAENGFFYKRYFAFYHSIQADKPRASLSPNGNTDPVISRSYATLRFQPHPRISFDVNHNYFRDLPTFDTRLIDTGLVDKLLFQGLSGGIRLELPQRISLYSTVGRTARTGDARKSINQMYGITLGRIWLIGLRADARYSTFDSSFGRGTYRALSLSRNFGETLRWEVQGGRQYFLSPLTTNSRSEFAMTSLDVNFGGHYFIQGGFTVERGALQNYQQWYTTFGYRFDNKGTK